jgi:hypothetical protein
MITLVTGLWNIGRDQLKEGWSRSYQHYFDKFTELLKTDCNMIIFGDLELEKLVSLHRKSHNTLFVYRDLNWFKKNEYYPLIQSIRNNPSWYNQVGWLKDSTQAKLELYNPLVMSKVFLLNDARILDKFKSKYLFWVDAGITNTVHSGYFTHDKVLNKIKDIDDKISFICFPYETTTEIHGFEFNKICEYSGDKVDLVVRGGFFGGDINVIEQFNSLYYQILMDTLKKGYMGTEESLFSILLYQYPNLFQYSLIESNGLIYKFFEDVKNNKQKFLNKSRQMVTSKTIDINKVGLYVITFNSPNQFETLIKSMLDYDSDFITKTKKFLLDNSTDLTTTPRYKELCEQYGFEHIKKDNIGIVGGRVWIAEHFDKTDLNLYYFFEDDLNLYPKKGEVCRNGFNRYVPNLYRKTIQIMEKEKFDFLKLSFSEFYGSNDIQFAWYNTPQDFRQKHWPDNPKLPQMGLDPNAPKTEFKNIKIHDGLPYITGEIYLCNWVSIFTKEGNYKCYLETKFAHVFEQTLMSQCYQETIKGKINSAILLLSPIEHHRYEFYDGKLRKES